MQQVVRSRFRQKRETRNRLEFVKNPAAVALGRLGGKATSEAKTRAVRENAKLGGWPKGRKRKKSRKARTQNSVISQK